MDIETEAAERLERLADQVCRLGGDDITKRDIVPGGPAAHGLGPRFGGPRMEIKQ